MITITPKKAIKGLLANRANIIAFQDDPGTTVCLYRYPDGRRRCVIGAMLTDDDVAELTEHQTIDGEEALGQNIGGLIERSAIVVDTGDIAADDDDFVHDLQELQHKHDSVLFKHDSIRHKLELKPASHITDRRSSLRKELEAAIESFIETWSPA